MRSYENPRFWPKDSETIVGAITINLSRLPDDEDRLLLPLADVVSNVDRCLREFIPSLAELSVQVS